jgi:hypothetical protein
MPNSPMLALVLLAALAAPLSAQTALTPAARPPLTDEGYEKVMKEIGSTFRSLQINNKVMNHGDGEREARRLATWFRDVQAYWEARKVEDAAGFARTAIKAAEDIQKSSTVMNMDVLQSAEKALAGACQSCHAVHRERLPDGTFRMKRQN